MKLLLLLTLILSGCATQTTGYELSNIDYPENTFVEVVDINGQRYIVKDHKPFEVSPEQRKQIDEEVR